MSSANDTIKTNKYPLHTFEEVEEKFFVYITNPESRAKIREAYDFVAKAHAGIYRKSGEPYIHHLIEVCYILTELNCGPSTLIAGLLHDVVEDTSTTLEDVEKLFGKDVRDIVDALTKIQRLKLSHRTEDDFVAEDHRKIFLGMAKDIRVILIKLADRLHNMRTLDSLSKERQFALARETMDVFAPIAHRLGIDTIKSELEDLSLKYLEPEKYKTVIKLINSRIKNGKKSLEAFSKRVADSLFEHQIPFKMESRVKSIYSVYRKIYQKNHKIDDIFDLLAIRIITKDVVNCYEILGLIHATYSPIPGRFKDYIAVPKPNMYQSLHTCVIFGDGNTFEVQIRTEEMDEVAERGIAAHWRYKEGTNYNPKQEQKEIEEQLHWLRDFVNLSDEDVDAKEYVNSLSHDIFEANVYVFTPMGRVINLPAGSTPLDFAYKIHTRVAETAIGAMVNNSLVPLNTELKTGDIVEIKTSNSASGPNEGWLNIATTSFAKAHIRKYLAKKNADFVRDDKISKGKLSVVETFKTLDIGEAEAMSLVGQDKVLEQYGAKDLDELLVMIANKNPTAGAIADFLNIHKKEEIKLEKAENLDNDNCPVYVPKAGRIAITLGSCCTPIPGDPIVGYITKGKGVTVHRLDCPNVSHLNKRFIEVKWKENLHESSYPVDLKIECEDRPSLLVDIMGVFSQNKVPVTAINATLHPQSMTTTVSATIYVSNSSYLTDVINKIKSIKSVLEINRATH